jgi:hypothetical protein
MDVFQQWQIVDAGDNLYYLQNRAGRRLALDTAAGQLYTTDSHYTGVEAQWKLTVSQHGWYFIDHPAASMRLSCSANDILSVSQSTSSNSERWFFIRN